MPKPITTSPDILNPLRHLFVENALNRCPEDVQKLYDTTFSLDAIEYLCRFPNESVDFVLTDEPYGITSSIIAFYSRGPMVTDFEWDDNLPAHLTIPWLYEAARILKPGGALLSCGVASWASTFEDVCTDAGLIFRSNHVWVKTNPPTRVRQGGWRSAHEMIFIASKGSLRERLGKRKQQELLNWHIESTCPQCNLRYPVTYSRQFTTGEEDWVAHLSPTKSPHKRHGHPTEKPEWLGVKYLDLLSSPGDFVIDPFMGSGEFVVAMKRMGRRRYSGNDLDPKWKEIVDLRLQNTQGGLLTERTTHHVNATVPSTDSGHVAKGQEETEGLPSLQGGIFSLEQRVG